MYVYIYMYVCIYTYMDTYLSLSKLPQTSINLPNLSKSPNFK